MVRDSTESKRCQGCGTEYYSTHPTECDECAVGSTSKTEMERTITMSDDHWAGVCAVLVFAMRGELERLTEYDHEGAKSLVEILGRFPDGLPNKERKEA